MQVAQTLFTRSAILGHQYRTERALRALSVWYWWPKMAQPSYHNSVCAAYRQYQLANIRRKHLPAPYERGQAASAAILRH